MLGPRKTKWSVGFFLACFLFVNIFGLFRPARVYALPVEVFADVTKVAENILEAVEDALGVTATTALMHAVAYFTRKLAYEAAVLVTSGATGQKSLIQEKGFDVFLLDELGNSAADAIGQLGKPFGLNLCQFPDIDFQVFLQVGLFNIYGKGGPTPDCSWQQFKDGWSAESFTRKYGNSVTEFMGERFNASLSVQNSDFGISLGAIGKIDALQAVIKDAKIGERLEGGGFKPVIDSITGNVKTPAQLVEEETKALTAQDQKDLTTEQLASAMNNAQLRLILPTAASVFLNTVASTLLTKLLSKGLLPSGPGGGGAYDPSFFGIITENRRAAQQAFSELLKPAIPDSDTLDIAIDFATCPDRPGLNNCVIDGDLKVAIDRGRGGAEKPLTIREALAEGLLHGDWQVISPRDEVKNTDKQCFRDKYCYSNIQKLRKARILPLGFEIAALKADPSHPPTLQRIVDEFERCAPDGRPNQQFPWCHLINPNWVIKAPEILSKKLIGPELVDPASPERRQEYMDFSTCVLEDENGNCEGNYGYCTQEKNIWRLGGDSCKPQYNTCKTYRSKGRQFSYLSRTLDYGECTVDTVGCRAYSMTQRSGAWQSSADIDTFRKFVPIGNNQTIFFDDDVVGKTCSPESEGCSAFVTSLLGDDGSYMKNTTTPDLLYMQKAPDYLGCYDADPQDAPIDWPGTVTEINNNIPANAACDKFASVCVKSEIGCESYTPTRIASAVPIPGIIGGNACDAACVGYDTFRQEATNFGPSEFPMYFIPSQGAICDPSHAGCDEFTNLDAVAQGGEGLEYYTAIKYCEKPDGANERAFYSWEGSSTDGFVLQVHRMLQVDLVEADYIARINPSLAPVFPVGSPSYEDNSLAALREYDAICNAADYALVISDPFDLNRANADCRALYDDTGTIFYRLLEHTVTVSEECHPLRKSSSLLYEDTALDAALCAQVEGLFENGACQRCYQGGRYRDGACVYQTISRVGEGSSCPASANGCRAFVGNTGNNREIVFNDEFEPTDNDLNAARAGWDGIPTGEVRVVSEALQVSGHSLYVNTTDPAPAPEAVRTVPAGQLRAGAFYELSFWARSNSPQNLQIFFEQNGAAIGEFSFDTAANQSAPETIGTAWQQYRFGPVEFTGDPALDTTIVFAKTVVVGSGATPYFLDFVQLTALQDIVHVVRDSWKTPEGYNVPRVCDANPDDVFPGIKLGCTEYRDSQNAIAYAAGFESLCREKAVGCQPLYDTFNTVTGGDAAAYAQGYNLWCERGTAAGNTCTIDADLAGPEPAHTCQIPIGATGCYIEEKVVFPTGSTIAGSMIHASTILLPPDTPEASPIFLAVRQEFQCRDRDLGCQKLGLEEHVSPGDNPSDFRFSDVYLLNNPDDYSVAGGSGTLCREEVVGCGEFTANDSIAYFRDPKITGAGTCSYRTVAIGTVSYDGWFLDDTEATPCYASFLRRTEAGLVYDIHSNRDVAYTGRVGVCPAAANSCTELVDPADTSELYPEGQPYYALFNDKIKEKAGACDGQVSLTEGCVLLDQTENPNKIYSSSITYSNSELATPRFSLVSPESAPVATDNDANLILKVDRDRTCAEWLACQSSVGVLDASGASKLLCSQYRACNATAPGEICTNLVPEGSAPFARLNESAYIRRDTSWYGVEYSGYSLFNKYQITNMTYVNFDLRAFPALRGLSESLYLAYIFDPAQAQCEPPTNNPTLDTNWRQCGPGGSLADPGPGGRCYGQRCLFPIEGTVPNASDGIPSPLLGTSNEVGDIRAILSYFVGGTCKAFPEKTSPFPGRSTPLYPTINSVAGLTIDTGIGEDDYIIRQSAITDDDSQRIDFIVKAPLFDNANVCQEGNCSCAYKKFAYKGGVTTDYWPFTPLPEYAPKGDLGVCGTGSENEGKFCKSNADCGTSAANPGICNLLQKRETHFGLSGFCLEPDLSRPINGLADFGNGESQEYACLTWLPIDTSASTVDFYNTQVAAGYFPDIDAPPRADGNRFGKLYCSEIDQGGIYDDTLLPDNEPHVIDIRNGAFSSVYNASWNLGDQVDHQECRPDNFLGFIAAGFIAAVCPACGVAVAALGGAAVQLSTNALIAELDDDESLFYQISCLSEGDGGTTVTENINTKFITLYRLLQYWSWQHISNDAVVLRLEIGGDSNNSDNVVHELDGDVDAIAFIHNNQFAPLRTTRGLTNTQRVQHDVPSNSTPDEEGVYTSPFASSRDRVPNSSDLYDTSLDHVYFMPIRYREAIRGMILPIYLGRDFSLNLSGLRSALQDSGNNFATIPLQSAAANYIIPQSFGGHDSDNVINFPRPHTIGNNMGNIFQLSAENSGTFVWNFAANRAGNTEFLFEGDNAEVRRKFVTVWFADTQSILREGDEPMGITKPNFISNLIGSGLRVNEFIQNSSGQLPVITERNEYPLSDNAVVSCEGGNSVPGTHHENWLAIAMNFGGNGRFLGYTSRWCFAYRYNDDANDHEAVRAGINFAVIADLSNQCTEIASVYDEQSGFGQNKAWTNRVWESAVANAQGTALRHPFGDYRFIIERTSALGPFGSVALPGDSLGGTSDQQSLLSYSFQDLPNGMPYSCLGDIYRLRPNFDLGQIRECVFGPQAAYFRETTISNRPPATVIGNTNLTSARNGIHELFAARYYIHELQLTTRNAYNIRLPGFGGSTDDRSQTLGGAALVPPQVYSLNPARCFGGRNLGCSAGEVNNITVNERNYTFTNYDGIGRPIDESFDGNGVIDPLIELGQYTANVQFFAFADDNRMPIRSVAIDWGDEQPINPREGFFKNRKPFCNDGGGYARTVGLCGSNENSLTPLTCKKDADCPAAIPTCFGGQTSNAVQSPLYQVARFGNSPRACANSRFEFTYTYTCNASDINRLTAPLPAWVTTFEAFNDTQNGFANSDAYIQLRDVYGLVNGDRVCVFQPRVHVQDNWGWCTGTCVSSPNGGCYNAAIETGQCNAGASSGSGSWIPYQGYIIVVPV